MKPLRRKQGLVVKELAEELLVYDLRRHEAHCLNPTAALVFKRCDGETTVAEMAQALRTELDVPADEAWVNLALDRFEKAGLLEEREAPPVRVSRRELMRHVGLAAAALLPLVSSLVAPTPAEAAATCVSDCTGQADFTPCNPPSCTSSCVSGACV